MEIEKKETKVEPLRYGERERKLEEMILPLRRGEDEKKRNALGVTRFME